MPDAYPVVADLQALLTGAGLLSDPPDAKQQILPWESYLLTARREWEAGTGYRPFLAAAEPSTRYFSAHDRGCLLIDLGGAAEVTAVTIDGVALTLGTDYYLYPGDGPDTGQPYTLLEFATRRCSQRNGIAVTARWGYADTLPDDVFHAVLCRAAVLAAAPVTAANPRPVEEVQQDDVKIKYSSSMTERQAHLGVWESAWKMALANYRLETIS